MTFLNPAVLFGLFAVAIPILIHLFNLNKVKKVEFSTLMFLKELQKTKIRKIKLEQLILLALRVLTIIFLVLSFAKPVFRGYAGGKDLVRKTAVIIIDNSFSMSAGAGESSYLDNAKEIAKKTLQNYSGSDEVYVFPSSFIGMTGRPAFTGDFGVMIDSIDVIGVSYSSLDISRLFLEVNNYISNSDNFINEIILISDFQSRNITQDNFRITSGGNSQSVVYLIDVNGRKPANLALNNVELETKILLPGRSAKIKGVLANYSDYNVSNQNLLLYINDELKAEKYIDAGSNSSIEFDFEFNIERGGSVNGRIELVNTRFDEDEIKQDNKFYFSIYVPAFLEIGLVNDDGINYSFVKTALVSSMPDELAGSRVTTSDQTLTQLLPGTNDLIILSGMNELSENEMIRLRDFVENGGGLIIFPEKGVNINSYNLFLKSMNAAEIISVSENVSNDLSLTASDKTHPVLSDIFSDESDVRANIDSPKLNSYFRFAPAPNNITVLGLSNGDPFLVESSFGNGKILLFAVSQGNTMSNFPLKNIFAPLVVRGAFYVSGGYSSKLSYKIGKQNLIELRQLSSIKSIKLPDGKEISYTDFFKTPDTGHNGLVLLPYNTNTADAGIYTFVGAESSVSFALNPEVGEGDLSKPSGNVITENFESYGFDEVIYSEGRTFDISVMQQYRAGLELWWLFLLLALLCISAEMILSKRLQGNS